MSLDQLAQSSRYLEIGTYSELSSEYYDPVLHPTCADFRNASRKLLHDLIDEALIQAKGSVCEVGAGKSLVAEVLLDRRCKIEDFLISDVSFEMLSYSKHFGDGGANLLVADANNLPFPDKAVDVLFAILADPYNVPMFWEESARILRRGGMMLFVIPSHTWASKFRTSDRHERHEVARFETRSGAEIFVPSYILPATEQVALALEFGFECIHLRTVSTGHLRRSRSPKLRLLESGDAVIEGYVFRNG